MAKLLFIVSLLLVIASLSSTAKAVVPQNATFTFRNEGYYGDSLRIEYDATYRFMHDLPAVYGDGPFAICFYNTTADLYTLAVRMGAAYTRVTTLRWVWEANRGNPVGENATFSLRPDGNLVLAHSDGRVAWQSNTANKGVVGLKFLDNGNMVLRNAKGVPIWQSFDYPTDTLLVGQSLQVKGGVNKLVSRLSEKENKPGPYTLVIEPKGSMSLYYKSPNTKNPLLYYTTPDFTVTTVTLDFKYEAEAGAYFFTLGPYISARAYHNSTLSFLRLTMDGNIEIITYNPNIERRAFNLAYAVFGRDLPNDDTTPTVEPACQLPERCGSFGVCDDDQCVGCPTERGLLGWSRSCTAPKKVSCDPRKSKMFRYYKVQGVDHFLSKYTNGEAIKESDCGKKCSSDCKCLGFFYNRESSRCWVAFELKTLTKVANSTHVGFIKTPN